LIRKDTAAVLIRTHQNRQVERNKAGASPTTFPAGELTLDLTLAAAGNHWTMFEMEVK